MPGRGGYPEVVQYSYGVPLPEIPEEHHEALDPLYAITQGMQDDFSSLRDSDGRLGWYRLLWKNWRWSRVR